MPKDRWSTRSKAWDAAWIRSSQATEKSLRQIALPAAGIWKSIRPATRLAQGAVQICAPSGLPDAPDDRSAIPGGFHADHSEVRAGSPAVIRHALPALLLPAFRALRDRRMADRLRRARQSGPGRLSRGGVRAICARLHVPAPEARRFRQAQPRPIQLARPLRRPLRWAA